MGPPIPTQDGPPESVPLSQGGWSLRIICLALGLLLLTAACLKLYDYSLDGVSRWAFLSSARLYIVVIAAEGGLGLWLLIGHPTRLLWFAALLFFAALAGVSVYLALAGQPSCGCFGKLAVSPWYSFGLDMLAVAALVFFRPELVYADTEGGGGAPFSDLSVSVSLGGSRFSGHPGHHPRRPDLDVWFSISGTEKSARRVGHGRSFGERLGGGVERRNAHLHHPSYQSHRSSYPNHRRQQ